MATAKQIDIGKWRIDVCNSGKKKTFRGKSRQEVEKKARNWLNEIDMYGKEIEKRKVQLNTLMLEYLLVNVKDSVSLGTFERYMSIYNTHFKACPFGDMDIKSITQVHAQQFINSKKELSAKSISLILGLLNSTLKHAMVNNLIRVNVVEYVKKPKSKKAKKEIEVLTLEEQKAFLKSANDSYYRVLFITALSTGMRVGEIVALKWQDIDFTTNIINVTSSARLVTHFSDTGKKIENKLTTSTTKTKAGKRQIPISTTLATELKKHKLSSSADNDYVFTNTKKQQIQHDSIAKAHKLVCIKANIKPVTFHCLRHTFATRAIESGVDYRTVSEILGHAKPSTTINLYVHSTNDTKRQAMDKISELISVL